MITIENGKILLNGIPYGEIKTVEGAVDAFEKLEDGAWRWHRHTADPTDHMRMELVFYGVPTFTMVPSVSYNGNGWGDFAEYIGDRDEDGTPWSWASHRVTVPACTYSENEHISIALMSEANDNTACSLYAEDDGKHHVVIFPEEEKPRTLQRHFWGEPFQGTMEPRQDFTAIIQATPSDGTKHRYKSLMSFAFRYFGHTVETPMKAEKMMKLSMAFCHFLYQRERDDGMAGFTTGAPWNANLHGYEKHQHRYQPGWVGQSTSMANAFIYDYLHTGNKLHLDMALEAHDKWMEHGTVQKGLFKSRVDLHERMWLSYDKDMVLDTWKYSEDLLESMRGTQLKNMKSPLRRAADGSLYIYCDACNLGTGAEGYFEAYELLKKAGIEKPEYLQYAIDVCDFALDNQDENGCFAKSWDCDAIVRSKKGTIGCFLILPLLNAYKYTGEKKYFDSAVRAFDFYYQELEEYGFTTAGALDTYSIDKESASPLLRCCMKLQEVTGDPAYIAKGEKIGWYLATWMMHFTVKYDKDTVLGQMGFDTFGSTSVSTPHNALDQYALRDVLSFKKLYELTGNIQWYERAQALWYGANQCISDGTLVVNGRLRPAGGQDEAIFHTRWGRAFVPSFMPSQWLPGWPCAFRMENLRWHEDHTFFDEGLQSITGKIG